MAIYRAVGQNTYEFVMKTQFSLGVDLTERFHPIGCPIIKYYTTDNATIRYAALNPDNSVGSSGASVSTGSSVTSASTFAISNSYVDGNACTSGHLLPDNGVEVDGETYYGSSAARFEFGWGNFKSGLATITIYPATYRIIKYQAATKTIVTEEYNLATKTMASSGFSDYTYLNYVYLTIPKTADDLILWIETEFPEE